MRVGILLLITGCIVGVSTAPESNPQEEWQWKDELRIGAELQIQADLQSGPEGQQDALLCRDGWKRLRTVDP